MEHRLHPRSLLTRKVKLVANEQLLGTSSTEEISAGGVKIRNPGLDLRCNEIVEVDFVADHLQSRVRTVIRSMVIYASEEYIGLMFADEMPLSSLG